MEKPDMMLDNGVRLGPGLGLGFLGAFGVTFKVRVRVRFIVRFRVTVRHEPTIGCESLQPRSNLSRLVSVGPFSLCLRNPNSNPGPNPNPNPNRIPNPITLTPTLFLPLKKRSDWVRTILP